MVRHSSHGEGLGDDRERVLLIVPAYNEEEALPGVLKELAEHAPSYDVLVVDDGSRDRTAEVARRAGARVAELPFNLGVGGALRVGFLYALRNGYERAVQFDGDGQHEALEIETLCVALDEGADLVIGSRFAEGRRDYPVGHTRRSAMRLLGWLIRALSGERLTDTSSGFRAFSCPLIEFFANNYPVEYLGDTVEALLLAHHAGFEIVEVQVSMRERGGGTPSNRNLRLAYQYFRLLVVLGASASMRTSRRRRR